MLLPQGTILPNFYFFSIFLQKLCCLKRLFIMQRGVGAAPPTPLCYFLLSSTPTIDTEPKIFPLPLAGGIFLVLQQGFEPWTPALKGRCSTC